MTESLTMRYIPVAAQPARVTEFDRSQFASADLKASRRAICAPCQFNQVGSCRECCGGVKIETLIRLTASHCARRFW